MTRKEMQQKKKEKEKQLIKSLEGKFLTSQEKALFRNTSVWTDFRKECYTGIDALTLRKLPKRWENHHMCLDGTRYMVLNKKYFRCLGNQSHDIIHILYDVYRKDKDVLKRLKKILDDMVKINNGMGINDFKKQAKKEGKIK